MGSFSLISGSPAQQQEVWLNTSIWRWQGRVEEES
jgi:hypothetical protein